METDKRLNAIMCVVHALRETGHLADREVILRAAADYGWHLNITLEDIQAVLDLKLDDLLPQKEPQAQANRATINAVGDLYGTFVMLLDPQLDYAARRSAAAAVSRQITSSSHLDTATEVARRLIEEGRLPGGGVPDTAGALCLAGRHPHVELVLKRVTSKVQK